MGRGFKSSAKATRIVLSITLLMTFGTFQYFPGMLYAQEAWYVLCFLALVLVYPIVKIVTGLRFSSFEIYLLILMPINVILHAWGAAREFGQPLFYGILAQRWTALIAAVLLLFIAMRFKLISFRDIEATLLLLAWGTFGLYLLMILFLNPADFVSNGNAFVRSDGIKAAFFLRGEFLTFGLIYYALLGLRRRRAKYYILSGIFLVFILSTGNARAFTVSFACAFLYYAYRWRPLGQFLLIIAKTCCVVGIVLGLLYAANRNYLSARAAGFSDAFTVASGGSGVEDLSANVRTYEVITAWPYILKHPLLGNGTLSNQWEGGTKELINSYFYAGDIGLIGVVYEVGLIGLLVFAYQFRFAIRVSGRLLGRMRSPLTDGCFGFLLINAFYSFSAAEFVFNAETTLFFIAVLVALPAKLEAAGTVKVEPVARQGYAV